jgi:hypothetical protein
VYQVAWFTLFLEVPDIVSSPSLTGMLQGVKGYREYLGDNFAGNCRISLVNFGSKITGINGRLLSVDISIRFAPIRLGLIHTGAGQGISASFSRDAVLREVEVLEEDRVVRALRRLERAG